MFFLLKKYDTTIVMGIESSNISNRRKRNEKKEEKIACRARGAMENSPAGCKQAVCIFKEMEKAIRDF